MAQLYQPIKGCIGDRDVTIPNVPVLDQQHVRPARFDPTFADSPTPSRPHRCRRAAACAGRRSDRVGTRAVAPSTGRPASDSSRRCGRWRDQRASTPVMAPAGTSEARSPVALLPLSPRQCTSRLTNKAVRSSKPMAVMPALVRAGPAALAVPCSSASGVPEQQSETCLIAVLG